MQVAVARVRSLAAQEQPVREGGGPQHTMLAPLAHGKVAQAVLSHEQSRRYTAPGAVALPTPQQRAAQRMRDVQAVAHLGGDDESHGARRGREAAKGGVVQDIERQDCDEPVTDGRAI